MMFFDSHGQPLTTLRCDSLSIQHEAVDNNNDNKEIVDSDDPTCQSLQVLSRWEPRYSHNRLQISLEGNTVSRRDYFELFPVALSRCLSLSCCITVAVKRGDDWSTSFGLIDLDCYAHDVNLADQVGKLPRSWGLCEDRTRATGGRPVWCVWADRCLRATGVSVSHWEEEDTDVTEELAEKKRDVLSIVVDLNATQRSAGKCYFVVNNVPVYCVTNLDCEGKYGIAATLAPSCILEILPRPLALGKVDRLFADTCLMDYSSLTQSEGKYFEDEEKEEEQREKERDTLRPPPTEMGHHTECDTPVPSFFPTSRRVLTKPPPSNVVYRPRSGDDDENSGLECCICLSSKKCVLFLPCKHICTCEECGIDRKLSSCPVCRIVIHSRTKVFL
jgi:hypothetical protein